MSLTTIVIAVAGLFVGVIVGYYLRLVISLGKKGSMELEIKKMMIGAKEEAQKIIDEGKKKAEEHLEELNKETKKKEEEWKQTEHRLIKKDELLDARQVEIDKEVEKIKIKIEEIKKIKERIDAMGAEKEKELEKVAHLSSDEAKDILFKNIEEKYEEDLLVRMQKMETLGAEKLDRRAKDILAASINRLASSTANEMMITSINIPNDEIKGKIIGKEGRNIRAFERTAGVELIIDETPGAIVISSFDPVRRQVARLALENLILDGRIQRAKIEEVVVKAQEDINKIIKEKGEQAVYECGIFNLDPELSLLLADYISKLLMAKMFFSIQLKWLIAGMLAEELGADVQVAKAGALVHDIGKALDHEVQGTHIDIGIRILEKFKADPRIIAAMKSHHDDYPHESIEGVIVQTADMISGGRPGARRDSVENYLKRLQELEELTKSFEGVEKAYALSAGREIRIFVTPEQIGDVEVKDMAREIAKKIEQELTYPGEIKVTVIRENRVIEYAR